MKETVSLLLTPCQILNNSEEDNFSTLFGEKGMF